jgi:hypothetical protein
MYDPLTSGVVGTLSKAPQVKVVDRRRGMSAVELQALLMPSKGAVHHTQGKHSGALSSSATSINGDNRDTSMEDERAKTLLDLVRAYIQSHGLGGLSSPSSLSRKNPIKTRCTILLLYERVFVSSAHKTKRQRN